MINNQKELVAWLNDNKIVEVECLIPDLNGIARGKTFSTQKFISGLKNSGGLCVADSIFFQMITGWEASDVYISDGWGDANIIPDITTIRLAGWNDKKDVAQVICDVEMSDGTPIAVAPRQVLKNVLKQYADLGLQPIVAPELEFYYLSQNTDPKQHLQGPIGISGRRESGAQAYSADALNEYKPFIDTVYQYSRESNLNVEGFLHEYSMGQMEINIKHCDALNAADQVVFFKRLVRNAALKHCHHATFMARPYSDEAGSSMHIHQSIVDKKTGKNIFANGNNGYNEKLLHYIGGLQKYLLHGSAIIYPNVNSYRRIGTTKYAAPVNLEWGIDNRTAGLRVPNSFAMATRVENRLAGSDANPYLMMALTLGAGLLGMQNKSKCSQDIKGDASEKSGNIPQTLNQSIELLRKSKEMKHMLGSQFVDMYSSVKQQEIDTFNQIITSWEREYLLLNV